MLRIVGRVQDGRARRLSAYGPSRSASHTRVNAPHVAVLFPHHDNELVGGTSGGRVCLYYMYSDAGCKPLGEDSVGRLRPVVLRHVSRGDLLEARGLEPPRTLTEVRAHRARARGEVVAVAPDGEDGEGVTQGGGGGEGQRPAVVRVDLTEHLGLG